VRLGTAGALVDEEETVVGRQDEAADARVAEKPPSGAELLHHLFEHRGTDPPLTRPVDLVTVNHNESRAGD